MAPPLLPVEASIGLCVDLTAANPFPSGRGTTNEDDRDGHGDKNTCRRAGHPGPPSRLALPSVAQFPDAFESASTQASARAAWLAASSLKTSLLYCTDTPSHQGGKSRGQVMRLAVESSSPVRYAARGGQLKRCFGSTCHGMYKKKAKDTSFPGSIIQHPFRQLCDISAR